MILKNKKIKKNFPSKNFQPHMGNQVQTVKGTKHGLVIESDCLRADCEGVKYKNRFYPWKKNFSLDNSVSGDISMVNGELYIGRQHWTCNVDGYEEGVNDDMIEGLFSYDLCYNVNMSLGCLVLLVLIYQFLLLS